MPGGPIIIIDPNKTREQVQIFSADDKTVYDEAREVIANAEASGEEVKILGAG